MAPTTYRNVSSFSVAWEDSAVLFDCGEGTLMQLLEEEEEEK
jgi:ribonuclease BN (tRNA processing enzyme)